MSRTAYVYSTAGFLVVLTLGVMSLASMHSRADSLPTDDHAVVPLGDVAPQPLSHYIEIVDGCDAYFEGPCVNMRSGPGTEYPIVLKLRRGVVLRVADVIESDQHAWYRIALDTNVRYPDRVSSEWYVARGDAVREFDDIGDQTIPETESATGTKRILVDRSDQVLYAYDGDHLFMQASISTGLEFTPTPRGIFRIYKKTPSRYMQGPLPGISDQYYDLPGVPWNLYFTYQGAVIHGAYWHDHFGEPWSHGCVNLSPEEARLLYGWADIRTQVTVRD